MICDEYNLTPLVSVRILTYNSSKYILETLDSVFNQTYKNIELVISDDCSTDNTVTICHEWIENHRDRFANVVLLTSSVNTGVCSNSKRSLEATTGDYIKGLGGDDALYPTAIEEFVHFAKENGCDICASRMEYMDEDGHIIKINHGKIHSNYMNYLKKSLKGQFRLCKQKIIVPGPVLFYSRRVLLSTGGPDERYGAADEWSFLYKTLKNGFKIFGFDSKLIKYRVCEESLTHLKKREGLPYYKDCNLKFLEEVIVPDLKENREYILLWHSYIQYLIWRKGWHKLLNLMDPMWYVNDAWYSIKTRLWS